VRSISLGGTIGIEVKPAEAEAEPPIAAVAVPVPIAATSTKIEAALGWQVAVDGGAGRGAHALVQRTTVARGAWAASLAISLGFPLEWRAANDVALDVARSGAILGGERRVGGGFALGVGAGALVYHRSTSTAPTGLAPTPSKSTFAFAAVAELLWRAPVSEHVALVAAAGVDVALGAPEAAIARESSLEVVDAIRALQPRASIAVEVGSW
jgi:hypothetical protein